MNLITGAHVILFSRDAEADRRFLQEVFEWSSVDAGGGWLIFALPPAEVAVHPEGTTEHPGPAAGAHQLYLMCEDLDATMAALAAQGIDCDEPTDEGWGILTSFALPSGASLAVYQPRHPLAHD